VEGILLDNPPNWTGEWELPALETESGAVGEDHEEGDLDVAPPVVDERETPVPAKPTPSP
jgi:hypothetical protein